MRRWFVVHTKPHAEARAHQHLSWQDYEAYLPRYLKRRRHARRTSWVAAPLFPRYLFVRLDPAETGWRPIHSTHGVCDIVRIGDRPAPVPVGVVEDIIARHGIDHHTRLDEPPPFEKGEIVRIHSGALSDAVGSFEQLDDAERVVVLLDMLGREVRVRVPLDSVAAYI